MVKLADSLELSREREREREVQREREREGQLLAAITGVWHCSSACARLGVPCAPGELEVGLRFIGVEGERERERERNDRTSRDKVRPKPPWLTYR